MIPPGRGPHQPSGRGLLDRARHPTRRVTVVAVIVAAIAVAVALDLGGSPAAPRPTSKAPTGPTVPGSDAVSATWYCAEGTGSTGGRADETVWIANVGDADARADITVMPGGDSEPASRRVTVPKRGQVRVPVSTVLETAEQPDPAGTIVGPGVVVEVFGSRAVVEHEVDGQSGDQTDAALGPCARDPGRDWYFAAGTTERGSEQSLALFNPFADDAILSLLFVTDSGFVAPADLQSLVVPRRSRVTVPLGNFVRRQARVGAHVHVRTGRIIAEQSLVFTSENETRRGVTLSLGAPAPARTWTLPGVVSEDGAAQSVYVANFDAAATEVEVAPRFEDGNTVAPSTVQVGGRSAVAVDLGPLVGGSAAFGVEVRATRDVPVVAELLGSWAPPAVATGSGTALGTPVPARGWAFAVTRFGSDDGATVSVFNPNRRATRVRLIAYESGTDRPASEPDVSVRAGKQATFDLNELGIAPGQVVVLRADDPVVAANRILGVSGAALAPGVPDPHAP